MILEWTRVIVALLSGKMSIDLYLCPDFYRYPLALILGVLATMLLHFTNTKDDNPLGLQEILLLEIFEDVPSLSYSSSSLDSASLLATFLPLDFFFLPLDFSSFEAPPLLTETLPFWDQQVALE